MDNHILIIGATGNIGGALVTELAGRKATIIAGTRQSSIRHATKISHVRTVPFDFEKPETMKAAFSIVDRAFLVLPLDPRMVAFGMAAIDAAKEAGLSFLLKSSELGADPHSSKLALQAQGYVDQYLKDSGISWSILRPNFFMQNFATHYSETIRKCGGIFLPQGSGKVSFIDVNDIAAVAAEILTAPVAHENCIYDLTGPEALSNKEVAEMLSKMIGRVVQYNAISDDAAMKAMADRGMPKWISDFVMSLHCHVREGRMANISSAVRAITGRQPRSFSQFVQTHAHLWKVEKNKTPDIPSDTASIAYGHSALNTRC